MMGPTFEGQQLNIETATSVAAGMAVQRSAELLTSTPSPVLS
jgi:hypothetical protein